jgi:hypothetical protein
MFRYRLVDQRVPAMWRSLAAAKLIAELPSAKVVRDLRLEQPPPKIAPLRAV